MYKKKNILCLIPARGGSKGIPLKNLKKIGKFSLVERALFIALSFKKFDRIIVSSDSKKIISKVNTYGEFAPFQRPDELATDKTPSLPVFKHALDWAEKKDKINYDWIVVLEPTCPFRLPEHIDAGLALAISKKASSIVSLIQLADHHPVRVKKLASDGRVTPFCIPEPEGLRRQDQKPAYIRNGGVYVFNRDTLVKNQLWGKRPYGFEVAPHFAVNIDEPQDLALAKIVQKKHAQPKQPKQVNKK